MADDPTKLSDADWRERLDPERYRVLRCSGTEAPFTGAYWSTKTPGTYVCAGCEAPLFRSTEKYDSGSGWPSFYDAVPGAVAEKVDRSHFMVRTEIVCARCGGHLGHVFPDGPRPTGLRYCTNSASLSLVPDEG